MKLNSSSTLWNNNRGKNSHNFWIDSAGLFIYLYVTYMHIDVAIIRKRSHEFQERAQRDGHRRD